MEIKLTRVEAKCDSGNIAEQFIFGWTGTEDSYVVYFDVISPAPKLYNERTKDQLRYSEIAPAVIKSISETVRNVTGVDSYLQKKLDNLKNDRTVKSIKVE